MSELSDNEMDLILDNIFKIQKEMYFLGFDVVVGTNENGPSGMIELKIKKRKKVENLYPNLLNMQFEGFKKGLLVYLSDFRELVIKRKKK